MMEVCLRQGAMISTRQMNNFVRRTCLRHTHSALENPASFERTSGRPARLTFRRKGILGSRLKTSAAEREIFPIAMSMNFSSSSLYTPAAEGESVPFVLKPEFDFDAILQNREQIEESVTARNMDGIDISKVISLWQEICKLSEQKIEMEARKKSLNATSKALSKQGGNITEEKEEIKQEGRRIRETLKRTDSSLNTLMNDLYPLALALPNYLHPSVPLGEEDRVMETLGDDFPVLETRTLHPEISTDHRLVHPGYGYAHGSLVLREMELLADVRRHLARHGFTQFSMPDVFKPITIEALGQNIENTRKTYAIETSESLMHLAGTSPMGFLAYYMMAVLEADELPHRCFSVGRHYNAAAESSEFVGLHKQFQDSRVDFFGVCEGTEKATDALMTQYLNILREIISTYAVPFRLVEVSSRRLLPCMTRKLSLEVWLPSEGSFTEVANVCSCSDFISRRLKIRYPGDPRQTAAQSRQRRFAHTIHGTALKSSVLLCAILEREALSSKSATS